MRQMNLRKMTPQSKMGIVKPKSKSGKILNSSHNVDVWKSAYNYLDVERDGPVPNNIPLTKRAIDHWWKTKYGIGYTNFATLYKSDIRSILSAAKRGEAVLTKSRAGTIAYYKLKGQELARFRARHPR